MRKSDFFNRLLAASNDGGLLIGFRSPLIEGRALIVRLRNPAAVIEQGAEVSFEEPFLLDLGGLGIRAIEPKAAKHPSGYWLLAGPVGAGQSRLFEWQMGATPTLRSDIRLPVESGTAEGLIVDASSGTVLVSTDRGEIGAPPCKDRPIDTRSFVIETISQ